jgi:hypothetical protein
MKINTAFGHTKSLDFQKTKSPLTIIVARSPGAGWIEALSWEYDCKHVVKQYEQYIQQDFVAIVRPFSERRLILRCDVNNGEVCFEVWVRSRNRWRRLKTSSNSAPLLRDWELDSVMRRIGDRVSPTFMGVLP